MTTLQKFKAALRLGVVVYVRNHYITREDHPCFGTHCRTVTVANSASYGWEPEPGTVSRMPWPAAANVRERVPGVFEILWDASQCTHGSGGGDLFLTVAVVPSPIVDGPQAAERVASLVAS